jgi:hypothetical protein
MFQGFSNVIVNIVISGAPGGACPLGHIHPELT